MSATHSPSPASVQLLSLCRSSLASAEPSCGQQNDALHQEHICGNTYHRMAITLMACTLCTSWCQSALLWSTMLRLFSVTCLLRLQDIDTQREGLHASSKRAIWVFLTRYSKSTSFWLTLFWLTFFWLTFLWLAFLWLTFLLAGSKSICMLLLFAGCGAEAGSSSAGHSGGQSQHRPTPLPKADAPAHCCSGHAPYTQDGLGCVDCCLQKAHHMLRPCFLYLVSVNAFHWVDMQ